MHDSDNEIVNSQADMKKGGTNILYGMKCMRQQGMMLIIIIEINGFFS